MRQFIFSVVVLIPLLGFSQLIGIKSIPLATGDQFNMYPAENYGMAGLTIAVDDTLNDAYHNPAKGASIQGINLVTLPHFYSITKDLGSAQNFPLGFNYGNNEWFCGGMFSLQQLKGFESNNLFDKDTNHESHTFD